MLETRAALIGNLVKEPLGKHERFGGLEARSKSSAARCLRSLEIAMPMTFIRKMRFYAHRLRGRQRESAASATLASVAAKHMNALKIISSKIKRPHGAWRSYECFSITPPRMLLQMMHR